MIIERQLSVKLADETIFDKAIIKIKENWMNWYIGCIKKYVDFSGRARRTEYWSFILLNVLVYVVLIALLMIISPALSGNRGGDGVAIIAMVLYYGYAFFIFLPTLAVAVRRLHDVGKSGWFLFISLIPIVGSIWLLVLYCTDSQPGQNQYGLNPKGVENPAV